MSAFLGPIHYWLFDKIILFEKLEENIKDQARSKIENFEEVEKQINDSYGLPIENKPLEAIIDESNIHGWLQSKIHAAELRQAALIKYLTEKQVITVDELASLYRQQGEEVARNITEDAKKYTDNPIKFFQYGTPKEVYSTLNTYLLEGMPCDRVDQEIKETETEYVWETTQCLHKPVWEKVGADIDVFYRLRYEWVKAFVESLPVKYKYSSQLVDGKKTNKIEKVAG